MSNLNSQQLCSLVRTTLAAVRFDEMTDGELLARFATTSDESAFAELVRRLGPSVLGVCRRILRTSADAEDVFQVVFMILSRKANSIQPPSRVAAWLHGVAVLAARKARAKREKRLARERALGATAEPAEVHNGPEPDLAAILDAEIQQLPEKYRLAVLLCEVREMTLAQAATQLGWPVGTVASRLSLGRKLLADRLRRRGIGSASILAMTGSIREIVAGAGVPFRLLQETSAVGVKGVAECATAAGGMQLVNEVFWSMTMSKVRNVCLGAVMAVGVTLGGAGFYHTANARQAASPQPEPQTNAAANAAEATIDRLKIDGLADLLNVESVRADVKLTEEQKKKIEAIRKQEAEKKSRKALLVGLPGMGLPPKVNLATSGLELDKAIAKELTVPQLRRMKQIVLQAKGPIALLDRRVIRHLGLSAEQEDEIEPIVPESPKGGVFVMGAGGPARDEIAEKIDAGWEAGLKLLKPVQKKKWENLIGKKLPTSELRKAQYSGGAGVNLKLPVGGQPGGGALPGGGGPPVGAPPGAGGLAPDSKPEK
jgi:RNA polymerase sigma-70 factor (ECF subfamily)